MAKARAIVKRLKAVRNIRKITRTMELIATARFKKAMDRASEAAAYTRKINEIVADLSRADLEIRHPLLEQREEVKKAVVLVITSNRGLCGGYNGGVLRTATARLRELEAAGTAFDLEVAGKRGISFMKFQGYPLDHAYTHFEDRPSFEEVNALAARYIEEFTSGRIDRLDVAWMEFQSASRQAPTVQTLLPIGRLTEEKKEEQPGANTDYEFLPSAEEILEEIVPASFKARLFKCFLDAAVSEQIFRMVAMKGATENADEMIGSLRQRYNRARQQQITSELSEIIGGAAALE
jgi:F-type H+-transporting ATPase subunit gamma